MFNIKEELDHLPNRPGVYVMKDEKGEIIYIGKAISLKNRVRQYFQSDKNQNLKTKIMVSNIEKFDYIITDTETEALILENNLIKKNKPKYNILLKDDKTYPYIKVTLNEVYPRVVKTRRVIKDGAKYYGPYTNVKWLNAMIESLNMVYPLKKCSKKRFNKNDKVCLNKHIELCLGMCQEDIDDNLYKSYIDKIIEILNGNNDLLIAEIEKKMQQAAKKLDFEKAAQYRDYIEMMKTIKEQQKVVLTSQKDIDVIGSIKDESDKKMYVTIFFVRKGKLLGKKEYVLDCQIEKNLESFIKQYYFKESYIPNEILVDEVIEDQIMIEQLLSEKKNAKVTIHKPLRGDKKKLLDLVNTNLDAFLKRELDRNEKMQRAQEKKLETLKNLLNLEKMPLRIESYDISNTSGVDSVGSMVVYEKGTKKTSEYRRFKIRSIIGPNDYGSIQEVLTRRFKRAIENQGSGFNKIPDLILIDGGQNQINIVERVLEFFDFKIPVVGMVKDEHHNTRGIIYLKTEFKMKKNDSTYRFIYEIQEETHRFAITYHKSIRDKKMERSILDDIKSVGEKRKVSLLKKFKTIGAIKNASIEELCKIEGISEALALYIKKHLETY